MKNRYNIALLPDSQSDQITLYAHSFSALSHSYLLGQYSLPHVTLCQFLAEKEEALHTWNQVIHALKNPQLSLSFEELSSISFDNCLFWISLLPKETPCLIQMHTEVIRFIQHPVSRIGQAYDPHMTLCNTQDHHYPAAIARLKKMYQPISDRFTLALGETDQAGQFLKVIQKYSAHPSDVLPQTS